MALTDPRPGWDGRALGTPESAWLEAGLGGRARPLELAGFRRLVVVSAHPDDETLGAGGLITRLHARGAQVTLIVASDGEGSHPGSPTHSPVRLGRRRRSEMKAAAAHLAPGAELCFLGLPDGRLADHRSRIADAIRRAIAADPPGTLLATPWHDDKHPDHQAVALAGSDAAQGSGATVVEFPVWAWLWASPSDPRLHPARLRVLHLDPDEITRKHRAIRENRSQLEPLGDALVDRPMLTKEFLEHFARRFEVFLPAGHSLGRSYFDKLYAHSEDPWRLAAGWYEDRKRSLTMAALTRPRFRSAFEPGCALGLLTEMLADRCDRLLATDISSTAVESARRRLGERATVSVQVLAVPGQWPDGHEFDLVVLSEIGYYLDRSDLRRLVARAAQSLTPDGIIVACHWRHPAPDHPLTGDEVHDVLVAESGLRVIAGHLEEDFRLDVLAPPGTSSVARLDGMLQ